MNEGDNFLMREIPYFNGTLFKVLTVETLQVNALNELAKAAELNWASIEPSIFGTLFERSLDPAKRSQLGAHYTSRDDILLIVEPVLMQPLRAEWEAIQAEAAPIRERFDSAATVRARTSARKRLLALRERILKRVRETTVLDPACGSGNFLYVSLQLLMDLEKAIIQHSLWAGLQMATREVHPRQMYGIELNPIAQALASIVVWIGYIQWRMNNGYGQEFGQPILEELEDNIVCKDAILSFDDEGSAIEPEWPAIDVVVGNPPFLGDKLMRGELGDDYVGKLRNLYQGRVPGGADLVTYWFEKAREEIEIGRVKRAGLLSTNSIRIGTNRAVLSSIKSTGDIFMAWSDREWPLEGANVRVSMIGFDDGTERSKTLDGIEVQTINSDLTASVDIADATPLNENANLSFLGVLKTGPFEISENRALAMIKNNEHNRAVIKPRLNGRDLVNVPSNKWIIDFLDMSENEALQFKEPYDYVKEVVKPVRNRNKVSNLREKWWQHARPRYAMRTATKLLTRFIATPEVTKHRIFGWVEKGIVPDHTLHVIARDDDYFMGILHSHIHILWAIRMGSTLGPAPRYNSSRTFKTFPFPWSPGQEDESHPAHSRISAAAKQLNAERDAWLNPPDMSEKELKDRTLTNLYNALNVFRGRDSMKTKEAAADFAPRLDQLHRELDQAVCDAYGWDYDVLDDEEEILRRLLARNLARAAQSG
ncbi:MAG: N-6 DNA methylase [Chloroflexi bacterium]|nr:N-6 DNA methylase [Chloroflexota bacterium]